MMLLPKELRSRRLMLGLSVEDLAARLGVEPLLLAHMEAGEEPITAAVPPALDALEREHTGRHLEEQR